jgi:hypothetical protein
MVTHLYRNLQAGYVAARMAKNSAERPWHVGVFQHLTGLAAFFDRISFGVYGIRRHRMSSRVSVQRSIPIRGPKQPFARAMHGVFLPTGNSFELRFGPNRKFPHLPPISLRFRSVACPVTVYEVVSVANDVLLAGFRIRPMFIENTFDLPDVAVADLRHRIVSSARYERELEDKYGARTFYVGSPRSPVQIRIYQKQHDVARLEVVLRSAYLRQHGIVSIGDVAKIRQIDCSKLLRLIERRPRSPLAADL